MIPIIILGSLQDHAVRVDIRGGGYSPCIGTTDFGLPKVIGYEEDKENTPRFGADKAL